MKKHYKDQGYTKVGKEILDEGLNTSFIENFNKIYEHKDTLSEKDWTAIISEYEGAALMVRDLYEKSQEVANADNKTHDVDSKGLFEQTKFDFERDM